ncbi:MAG: hypothetical protein OEW15_07860 [Nitrospirota bacterium]|nr:hypothetical protein [Nitrospirota bacterium]
MIRSGTVDDGTRIMKSFACYVFMVLSSIVACAPIIYADDLLSMSGRLDLRSVHALQDDSVPEHPSLDGRIKVSAEGTSWRFHSWIEGGWDGSVKGPDHEHGRIMNFADLYQRSTPYLEFKELCLSYSTQALDLRAGIQRFAWGRIDEYPSNDLLNPWDYTRFPRKPLEDRKIGVPSLSASINNGDWTVETVWVPVFVPYRLPLPDERWSGTSIAATMAQIPNAEITVQEPDLPDRTFKNSTIGMRMKYLGTMEWSFNLFHGYDPKPVFKTTSLAIVPIGSSIVIDPGYVPDFHRMATAGFDASFVTGGWSLRAEASYAFHRYVNIRHELWGYPTNPGPGVYPLDPAEEIHDSIDYGIGADYRLFEDGHLTVQGQQTMTLGNVDDLYERKIESILWANLKTTFMNQKIETNMSAAFNPEHNDRMIKINGWYVVSDAWKAGATWIAFTGPEQSFFGRYARNDRIEAEVRYFW